MLILGCGEKIKPGESGPEAAGHGVSVEEVRYSDRGLYETSGTLRSRNTALVSAKIMGEVTG
jgi:hypothetical protein